MLRYLFLMVLLFSGLVWAQQTNMRGANVVSSGSNKSVLSGEVYGLVVGISKYMDSSHNLDYADDDAQHFYDYLISPGGANAKKDNVFLLLNEKATAMNIWAAMGELKERAAKSGNRIYIFFAGHGDATSPKKVYLLAHDATFRPAIYNAGGTVEIGDLKDDIMFLTGMTDNLSRSEVILITDACRSNELPGGAEGLKHTYNSIMTQRAGEIQLVSCGPNEQAKESENWGGGRGVYSYYLIQGLYGLADQNNDSLVSLKELTRYVEDSVSLVTSYKQNPTYCCAEYNTVLISAVNRKAKEELIATLKLKKNASSGNETAMRSRGGGDYLLENKDSAAVNLIKNFYNAIEGKKFINPFNKSASEYYSQFLAKFPNEKLQASSMKRSLISALTDESRKVLHLYLNQQDTLFGSQYFSNCSSMLKTALGLLDDNDKLKKEFQTWALFIEATSLSRNNKSYKKALIKCDSALIYQPDAAYVYYLKGYIQKNNGKYDDAVKSYELAVKLAPGWNLPYLALATLFYELKSTKQTLGYIEKALAVTKNSSSYSQLANNLMYQLADIDRAESMYLKSLELNSLNISSLNGIAYVYKATGDMLKSKEFLDKAYTVDSANYHTMLGLSDYFYESDKEKDAVSWLKKILKTDTNYIYAARKLGDLYYKGWDFDSSYVYYRRYLNSEPNDRKISRRFQTVKSVIDNGEAQKMRQVYHNFRRFVSDTTFRGKIESVNIITDELVFNTADSLMDPLVPDCSKFRLGNYKVFVYDDYKFYGQTYASIMTESYLKYFLLALTCTVDRDGSKGAFSNQNKGGVVAQNNRTNNKTGVYDVNEELNMYLDMAFRLGLPCELYYSKRTRFSCYEGGSGFDSIINNYCNPDKE